MRCEELIKDISLPSFLPSFFVPEDQTFDISLYFPFSSSFLSLSSPTPPPPFSLPPPSSHSPRPPTLSSPPSLLLPPPPLCLTPPSSLLPVVAAAGLAGSDDVAAGKEDAPNPAKHRIKSNNHQ